MPFWRKRSRAPVPTNHPEIRFVGEQDGEPERQLKGALSALFSREERVRAAYLAVAEVGAPGQYLVVLGISSPEDPDLAAKIGEVFSAQFAKGVPLDIAFLSDAREVEIQSVCSAFYSVG